MLTSNAQLPDDFTIRRDWNDHLARQLVEVSNDPIIKRFTPRDADERFTDLDAATHWYKSKHPAVYALWKAAQLAGIVWYSHNLRADLDADYTFAIRMYGAARGKGLATPFMQACEDDFRETIKPNGVWLETDTENVTARALYHKLGYEVVKATDRRITMRK